MIMLAHDTDIVEINVIVCFAVGYLWSNIYTIYTRSRIQRNIFQYLAFLIIAIKTRLNGTMIEILYSLKIEQRLWYSREKYSFALLRKWFKLALWWKYQKYMKNLKNIKKGNMQKAFTRTLRICQEVSVNFDTR